MNRARKLLPLFTLLVVSFSSSTIVSGCKGKTPEPAHTASVTSDLPEFPPPDPPREMDLDSLVDPTEKLLQQRIRKTYPEDIARWEQEREDRKELVRPAPANFKPKAQGRRLELTLIPKSHVLRKGRNFWYRAELQNVGTEAVLFKEYEHPTFFKDGGTNLGSVDGFLLRLLSPSGSKVQIVEEVGTDCTFHRGPIRLPGWEKMTEEDRGKALALQALREKTASEVRLRILPGETLTTRPFRFVSSIEICELEFQGKPVDRRVAGPFRELNSQGSIEEIGVYSFQLVFQETPPSMPTGEELKTIRKQGRDPELVLELHREMAAEALGTIESNIVRIEVVP